jgi:hypothetical protein
MARIVPRSWTTRGGPSCLTGTEKSRGSSKIQNSLPKSARKSLANSLGIWKIHALTRRLVDSTTALPPKAPPLSFTKTNIWAQICTAPAGRTLCTSTTHEALLAPRNHFALRQRRAPRCVSGRGIVDISRVCSGTARAELSRFSSQSGASRRRGADDLLRVVVYAAISWRFRRALVAPVWRQPVGTDHDRTFSATSVSRSFH